MIVAAWVLWESRRLTIVVGGLWGTLKFTRTGDKNLGALKVKETENTGGECVGVTGG